jgi:hypothetical protein
MGMKNHGVVMSTGANWFVRQSAIWQSYQQSHLVANQEDLSEENYEFCGRNHFFIIAEFL